jgi:hypothetical protein
MSQFDTLNNWLQYILLSGFTVQLAGRGLRIWNKDKKFELINGWDGMKGLFVGEVRSFHAHAKWVSDPQPFLFWCGEFVTFNNPAAQAVAQ